MPESKSIKGWQRGLGYGLFGFFAFLLFLYLTFPFEAVQRRATFEAARAGWRLSIGSLGPGFFGVTAHDVRVMNDNPAPVVDGAPPVEREPLRIPRLSARPSLFPMGVAFSADLMGGEVKGSAGGLNSGAIELTATGLDPEKGNLKAFSGVDLAGRIDATIKVNAPLTGGITGKEFDLTKANGSIELQLVDFTVKGGTVTVPMYGTMTPMDLPRISLGRVSARVKIVDGVATVEDLAGSGQDLDLKGGGTIKLGKRLDYSEANLDVKLKGSPEFSKSMVGTALVMLPPDRQDPAFRSAHIGGLLGDPKFGPGR